METTLVSGDSCGVCVLRVHDTRYSGQRFYVPVAVVENQQVIESVNIRCDNPFLRPDTDLTNMLITVSEKFLGIWNAGSQITYNERRYFTEHIIGKVRFTGVHFFGSYHPVGINAKGMIDCQYKECGSDKVFYYEDFRPQYVLEQIGDGSWVIEPIDRLKILAQYLLKQATAGDKVSDTCSRQK